MMFFMTRSEFSRTFKLFI